jgi:hypothetical protein
MPNDTEEAALRRRIGRFRIANSLLHDTVYGNAYVSELARVFEMLAFIPLGMKILVEEDATEITGISKLFGIRTKGSEVPFYHIQIYTTWDEAETRHRVSRLQVDEVPAPMPRSREASLQYLIEEFGRADT